MSSASRGSGTRLRMKLRSRDCSRPTTSEMRWSCSRDIRFRPASFTYGCRRMRAADIVGGYGRLAAAEGSKSEIEPEVDLAGILHRRGGPEEGRGHHPAESGEVGVIGQVVDADEDAR